MDQPSTAIRMNSYEKTPFILVIQLSTEYMFTFIGCILSGAGRAISMVFVNVVVANCVPIERLPAASGIFMLMDGLLVIIGGPFIGW